MTPTWTFIVPGVINGTANPALPRLSSSLEANSPTVCFRNPAPISDRWNPFHGFHLNGPVGGNEVLATLRDAGFPESIGPDSMEVARMREPKVEVNPVKNSDLVAYFGRACTIVRPVLGPLAVSAGFVIVILTVTLKYTIAGSSWMYSVISAVLIAVGVGLAVLSTTMVLNDDAQRK
jgi:hypothetical protein